jgi:hypothetical protein
MAILKKLGSNYMNNKGETQLVFTLLVSSILLTIYLYFQFSVISVKKMQERIDSYLCYKSYQRELNALTEVIHKTNLAIAPLLPLTLVPSSAKLAQMTVKSLQTTQDLKFKHYLARMVSNSYCHFSLKGILLRSHPYRTVNTAKLYRDQTAVAQLGKKEWSLNLFGKKNIFPIIRLRLNHKSALSSETRIEAAELEVMGTPL